MTDRKNKPFERKKQAEEYERAKRVEELLPTIEYIIDWLHDLSELKILLEQSPRNKIYGDAIRYMMEEEPYKTILGEEKNKQSFSLLNDYQEKQHDYSERLELRTMVEKNEFFREWRLRGVREGFRRSSQLNENSGFQPVVSSQWKPLEVGKEKENKGYPPYYLQEIIETAVRLYERRDKVRAVDIFGELEITKKTYNVRIKHFGYTTPMILAEARLKLITNQSEKSSKR